MDMILTDKERSLIIEYRKHDEDRKRCVRILLDMESPSEGKIVSLQTERKRKEGVK